jgi:hypothetical protein
VSPLGALFRRCSGIDNLFDRFCGQFFRACGARWPRLFGLHLDSQPELDQAADGFGARGRVIFRRPFVDGCLNGLVAA